MAETEPTGSRPSIGGIEGRSVTAWLSSRVEGGRWRWELGLYAVAAVAAWWVRSVQDDAFISFRYAKNLANGSGLVFNSGERVEGYTNFLWTLILWIPEHFGWNTPMFSVLVTIPLMIATLAVSIRFARRVYGEYPSAWLTGALLVANMTFLAYATSGLETMLQTLLVTSVAALLVPAPAGTPDRGPLALLGAGALGGLAIMTRIDSVVLVGAWFLVHLWALRRDGAAEWRWPRLAARAGMLGVPVLALVVPWLAWKADYYGTILPNTLEAKSWSNSWVPFLYGVFYLFTFFASYAAFLLIGRWRRLRGQFPTRHATRPMIAVLAAWALYICVVGADFMEYRFVVPVLPILAVPAAFLIDRYRTTRRQIVLVSVLVLVSLVHRVVPTIIPYPVLTIEELKHWPEDSPNSWERLGKLLAEAFPGGSEVPGQPVVGIIPAGVVPYYSDLESIDMLGLNDEWVAKNGLEYPLYFPGHVRTATIDYLERRNVSLLIGAVRGDCRVYRTNQPTLPCEDRKDYRISELLDVIPAGDLANLPPTAKVLEIPFKGNDAWQFIYLTQNDKVDAAIAKYGWRLVPITMTCDPDDIAPVLGQLFSERTCPSTDG